MIRKYILFFFILGCTTGLLSAQSFVKTSELFRRSTDNSRTGALNLNQDQAIDTLISRYILSSKKLKTIEGTQGMDGFRIQIYYSSVRNAREESSKARAEFINNFPEIISYAEYAEPGYFMVRAGDYRTKNEGYKYLIMIRKEFPNAYLVPAVINFPDLNTK
jgi:hypothetical protein